MKSTNGFSLVELLVVMTLLLAILSGVYFMILHYGEVSETEHSRIRLQQESRFMLSSFSQELKSAGAVLTLAHSAAFLSSEPHFNGIYPLNNTSFADGIIIATGDPDAVTTLTQTFDASSGTSVITVESTEDMNNNPLWASGDMGIIIGPSVDPGDASKTIGYYVFMVSSVTPPTATTITLRSEPVYYSGLLATDNYTDTQTENGNAVIYPVNAPVIKLANFSIYLLKQIYNPSLGRNTRQLIRVSDANNQADVLDDSTTAVTSVVSENVWDMQISYAGYPDFPVETPKNEFFAGGTSSTSLSDLLDCLRSKEFKEMTITFVVLTDEYGGTGEQTLTVPEIGDRTSSYNLPTGKYTYKILSFLIEPRNFNIAI